MNTVDPGFPGESIISRIKDFQDGAAGKSVPPHPPRDTAYFKV
jgi:hypothetical protein